MTHLDKLKAKIFYVAYNLGAKECSIKTILKHVDEIIKITKQEEREAIGKEFIEWKKSVKLTGRADHNDNLPEGMYIVTDGEFKEFEQLLGGEA